MDCGFNPFLVETGNKRDKIAHPPPSFSMFSTKRSNLWPVFQVVVVLVLFVKWYKCLSLCSILFYTIHPVSWFTISPVPFPYILLCTQVSFSSSTLSGDALCQLVLMPYMHDLALLVIEYDLSLLGSFDAGSKCL